MTQQFRSSVYIHKNKIVIPHKNSNAMAYNSIIYNSQNMGKNPNVHRLMNE